MAARHQRQLEHVHHAPGLRHVLALLVIETLVTAAVWWKTPSPLADAPTAVGMAALVAVVFGIPALFWAITAHRDRLWHAVLIGAVVGVVPPVLWIASGVIGQLFVYPFDSIRASLRVRLPLPGYGAVNRHHFALIETHAVIVAVSSAAIFWLLIIDRRRSRPVAQTLSFVTLLAAMQLAAMIQ